METGRPMTARQMEKEAQRAALEFEREITLGFRSDNRQTFEQYAAYCYGLREQRGDKPQTLTRVKRQTARINEYIGHMKLEDIISQHLTALYKKLSEPGQNRWRIYAVPAVDFNELKGTDNYSKIVKNAEYIIEKDAFMLKKYGRRSVCSRNRCSAFLKLWNRSRLTAACIIYPGAGYSRERLKRKIPDLSYSHGKRLSFCGSIRRGRLNGG